MDHHYRWHPEICKFYLKEKKKLCHHISVTGHIKKGLSQRTKGAIFWLFSVKGRIESFFFFLSTWWVNGLNNKCTLKWLVTRERWRGFIPGASGRDHQLLQNCGLTCEEFFRDTAAKKPGLLLNNSTQKWSIQLTNGGLGSIDQTSEETGRILTWSVIIVEGTLYKWKKVQMTLCAKTRLAPVTVKILRIPEKVKLDLSELCLCGFPAEFPSPQGFPKWILTIQKGI